MRIFITFLLVGLSFVTLAQSNCGPDFKTIYDFEIGDEFNYKLTTYDWGSGNGSPLIRTFYYNFKVISKLENGDTTIYIVDGNFPPSSVTQTNYSPFGTRNFNDTIVLIDSINHNLNQCADSIILFDFFDVDSVFSSVVIQDDDTIKYKIIGGINNLFSYMNNKLVNFSDFDYEEKYSSGLGMTFQSSSLFEVSETMELISYIKSGDTITLITSNVNEISTYDLKLFPNPLSTKLNISLNSNDKINSICIYNAIGELIHKIKNQDNEIEIDFSTYNRGVYFIDIWIDDKKITKKIIKQ